MHGGFSALLLSIQVARRVLPVARFMRETSAADDDDEDDVVEHDDDVSPPQRSV